jgi:hypothetical protein
MINELHGQAGMINQGTHNNRAPVVSNDPEIAVVHSDQIGDIVAALALAQLGIKGAQKDSTNPHFKSSYADMASVWDACHEALNSNGIAVLQIPIKSNGKQILVTLLAHKSGQWFRGECDINPVKNDPQGIGSAITYLRRYCLSSMAGVAPREDDDDGEAASGRGEEKRKAFGALRTDYVPDDSWREQTPQKPSVKLETTPPPPDVLVDVPEWFASRLTRLKEMSTLVFKDMQLNDLELLKDAIQEKRASLKTDRGRQWATALEMEATLRIKNTIDGEAAQ